MIRYNLAVELLAAKLTGSKVESIEKVRNMSINYFTWGYHAQYLLL